MADIFRFKQFEVDQTGCAMKVNTDGALLGALTTHKDPKSIMEIGAGTGFITLMLAQRFEGAQITAVEIEPSASATCIRNLSSSKFSERVEGFAVSFQEYFALNTTKKFDLIVSNPPFFTGSLENTDPAKSKARHATDYFYSDLFSTMSSHLNENGSFEMIVPFLSTDKLIQTAFEMNLFVEREISIRSFSQSKPHRTLLKLRTKPCEKQLSALTIYDKQKEYSKEYQHLLSPFLTIF